jgi:hypothetical protein
LCTGLDEGLRGIDGDDAVEAEHLAQHRRERPRAAADVERALPCGQVGRLDKRAGQRRSVTADVPA